MPDGLKIVVGADVQQATKALAKDVPAAADKAGDAFQQLGNRVKASTSAFNRDLPQSIEKSRASVMKLVPPISKLGDSLETLKAKLGARQSFLNVEKDIGKIAILNREIAGLNREIARIEGVGTSGFGAVGKGATSALSAVRSFAYILPGIGVAGILGGLSDMVVGLFKSAEAFDKASLAGEIFKDTLDDIKAASDRLEDFLDLQNKIADIKFRIAGGEGAAADINNFKNQIKSNDAVIKNAAKNLDIFSENEQKIVKTFKSLTVEISKFGIKNPIIELARSGKDLTKITKEEADKLPGVFKVLANQFIENRQALAAADKTYTETVGKNTLLRFQIQQSEVEEQRRSQKLAATDFEKYVSEVISRAKKISDAFKGGISIRLRESVLDTRSELFQKSLKFLRDFDAGNFTFTFSFSKIRIEDVEFPPVQEVILDQRTDAQRFSDILGKQYTDYFKENPVDISLVLAVQNATLKDKQQGFLSGLFGSNTVLPKIPEFFSKSEAAALQFASVINNTLQPAFQGVFDAILAGENPLKAFFQGLGQAVAQLIQKLISAAITAAILSSIFPGGLGTAKGFGGFFKAITGFASGGIVSGPTLALIGEGSGTSRSNPEVVAPLDQLRSMLGDLGTGGRQMVYVTGRLRGNDMILQNARTSRSQRRTTGR